MQDAQESCYYKFFDECDTAEGYSMIDKPSGEKKMGVGGYRAGCTRKQE